jgi:hypothetical protein
MQGPVAAQDFALLVLGRVVQGHMQHEAIQLRFRQRVSAGLLDRILRGHDHEQRRQRTRLPTHGDLALLHGFQQG